MQRRGDAAFRYLYRGNLSVITIQALFIVSRWLTSATSLVLVGHSQQRPASDLHIRVYKVVLLVSSAAHDLPLLIPAVKHVRSELSSYRAKYIHALPTNISCR